MRTENEREIESENERERMRKRMRRERESYSGYSIAGYKGGSLVPVLVVTVNIFFRIFLVCVFSSNYSS